MKVAAHPLVVAVAMGLLGPSVLEAKDDVGPPKPCVDCDEAADPLELASSLLSAAPLERIDAPTTADTDVESWLAHPVPTPEARARALAEYLATEA